MQIDTEHDDYKNIAKRWDIVRSIVKNNAKHLIRIVDRNDSLRSEQYRTDAILTNFTRLTRDGLNGLVFRKDSKKSLPQKIQYLEDDCTGYKFSLDQLAQKLVGETLETGRNGLLADYPNQSQGEGSKAARIRLYNAESIKDWDYKEFGSEYKLRYVKLMEQVSYIDFEDDFKRKDKKQYRVLILNDMEEYQQLVYSEDGELVSIITPLDYNGNPFNEVPFTFVGSENNDAEVDAIPLYDLSVVNLGHYKASADLMESMFVCGQVVPVVNTGEVGEEQWHAANPNGILVGSRTPVVVGNGGSFDFKQAGANTLPQQVMNDLEKQAAAIGARLIAPPGGRETAEAAKIRYGSQNSVLYTITRNISEAIERVLGYAAMFMMEKPEESEYELNDQFYEENADPNLIAQELMMLDRGLMSMEEVRDNLKKTGIKLRDGFNPENNIDPMQGIEDDEPIE